MTSADILIRISNLKDEVESRTKEIESLEKELKEIGRKEAEKIMREKRERANKIASFIKHNYSRTVIVEVTLPEITEDGEYLGEKAVRHILKKGEYDLYRNDKNEWCICKEYEFCYLLEYVDNIYIAFE